MGTSSEDVLLMVNHVRHKKNDGTLYLMAERIAWMLESKDTFSISHKYADVKMQKISPEGKAKIQLQVVLHNGEATTFHFVNPMGTEAQLKDRNDVKEWLQQLLPKFKRKVNKELEEKNRILAEDPELFQLYRDLVVSQVITAEEFWENRAARWQASQKNSVKQDVGVSAAFLADVKPQTDGCNGLKYNITPDIIESIFRTYPAVKKKHMENVPHKLSESEFWTRFFQSHYFHRDRLNWGSKDLFTECAKSDEQDIKHAIQDGIHNPLMDINSFEDNTMHEGYGSQVSSSIKPQGTSAANQSMIRRFNHHSMMVLKSSFSQQPSTSNNSQSATTAAAFTPGCSVPLAANGLITSKAVNYDGKDHGESIDNEDIKLSKKRKIQEKIEYDDLQNDDAQSTASLNLTRVDRYFHGPTPVTDTDYESNDEILQTVNNLKAEVKSWNPHLPQALNSTAAISVLGELSPGGALMKTYSQIPLKDTVPADVQQELRQLYSALLELLRHFWSCFPTTSPQLEEKALRMQATLERFQYAKLQPFQDRLLRDHLSMELTEHLKNMLQSAYNKFSTWQTRRMTLGKK